MSQNNFGHHQNMPYQEGSQFISQSSDGRRPTQSQQLALSGSSNWQVIPQVANSTEADGQPYQQQHQQPQQHTQWQQQQQFQQPNQQRYQQQLPQQFENAQGYTGHRQSIVQRPAPNVVHHHHIHGPVYNINITHDQAASFSSNDGHGTSQQRYTSHRDMNIPEMMANAGLRHFADRNDQFTVSSNPPFSRDRMGYQNGYDSYSSQSQQRYTSAAPEGFVDPAQLQIHEPHPRSAPVAPEGFADSYDYPRHQPQFRSTSAAPQGFVDLNTLQDSQPRLQTRNDAPEGFVGSTALGSRQSFADDRSTPSAPAGFVDPFPASSYNPQQTFATANESYVTQRQLPPGSVSSQPGMNTAFQGFVNTSMEPATDRRGLSPAYVVSDHVMGRVVELDDDDYENRSNQDGVTNLRPFDECTSISAIKRKRPREPKFGPLG